MIIKELQKLTTKIVYIGALMLTSCGESGEFVYNNLSENKILFTTRTVEGWTGQQAKSRAVLENNEKEPIIGVICKSPWIKVDMVALFLPQDVAQL